jgi:hypothetical protein
MDIMLTVDGIHTLINIIIVNPIHVDFVLKVTSLWRMATRITTQAKTLSYYNQHHKNDFILLAMRYLNVYTSKQMTSFK